jgi:hypothetical protein
LRQSDADENCSRERVSKQLHDSRPYDELSHDRGLINTPPVTKNMANQGVQGTPETIGQVRGQGVRGGKTVN